MEAPDEPNTAENLHRSGRKPQLYQSGRAILYYTGGCDTAYPDAGGFTGL